MNDLCCFNIFHHLLLRSKQITCFQSIVSDLYNHAATRILPHTAKLFAIMRIALSWQGGVDQLAVCLSALRDVLTYVSGVRSAGRRNVLLMLAEDSVVPLFVRPVKHMV